MLGTKKREPTEGAKFKKVEGIVERDERVKEDQEPKYSHFYTVVARKDELFRVCGNCGAVLELTSDGSAWLSVHEGDGFCLVFDYSP